MDGSDDDDWGDFAAAEPSSPPIIEAKKAGAEEEEDDDDGFGDFESGSQNANVEAQHAPNEVQSSVVSLEPDSEQDDFGDFESSVQSDAAAPVPKEETPPDVVSPFTEAVQVDDDREKEDDDEEDEFGDFEGGSEEHHPAAGANGGDALILDAVESDKEEEEEEEQEEEEEAENTNVTSQEHSVVPQSTSPSLQPAAPWHSDEEIDEDDDGFGEFASSAAAVKEAETAASDALAPQATTTTAPNTNEEEERDEDDGFGDFESGVQNENAAADVKHENEVPAASSPLEPADGEDDDLGESDNAAGGGTTLEQRTLSESGALTKAKQEEEDEEDGFGDFESSVHSAAAGNADHANGDSNSADSGELSDLPLSDTDLNAEAPPAALVPPEQEEKTQDPGNADEEEEGEDDDFGDFASAGDTGGASTTVELNTNDMQTGDAQEEANDDDEFGDFETSAFQSAVVPTSVNSSNVAGPEMSFASSPIPVRMDHSVLVEQSAVVNTKTVAVVEEDEDDWGDFSGNADAAPPPAEVPAAQPEQADDEDGADSDEWGDFEESATTSSAKTESVIAPVVAPAPGATSHDWSADAVRARVVDLLGSLQSQGILRTASSSSSRSSSSVASQWDCNRCGKPFALRGATVCLFCGESLSSSLVLPFARWKGSAAEKLLWGALNLPAEVPLPIRTAATAASSAMATIPSAATMDEEQGQFPSSPSSSPISTDMFQEPNGDANDLVPVANEKDLLDFFGSIANVPPSTAAGDSKSSSKPQDLSGGLADGFGFLAEAADMLGNGDDADAGEVQREKLMKLLASLPDLSYMLDGAQPIRVDRASSIFL